MRPTQRTLAMCLVGTLAAAPLSVLAQTSASTPPAPPLAASASAAPLPSLTLAQAVERALAGNRSLRGAEREIEAAEAAIMQGGALPNPSLSYEMEDTKKATRTTTLMLSQPLELGGKRAARIAAAEYGRDVASSQLALRRAELIAQVGSVWREVLAEQEGLRFADDAWQLAQRATQAAAKRVQAGSASPLEETRARVEELNARLARSQAEAALASARNRLAALWGDSRADFPAVDGSLDALPAVPVLEALLGRLEQAPALRMAQQEGARRQALADVERSRRYPDLTLSVGRKQSREDELKLNQTVLGVSVPLPLFDTNRGNLREALVRSEQAQDELQALRANLASDLLQARSRLAASRLEAEGLAREIVPAAQQALEATTRGYALGKFGFLDLLDAQRSLFQVRQQQLRAWLATHQAAAEIARMLGEQNNQDNNMNPAR